MKNPTEEQLKKIQDWDITIKDDISDFIDYLRTAWNYAEIGYFLHDPPYSYLELHTGGWSGNEAIIEVLENTLFWTMCWQKSLRGGHYYFEIRP